MAPISSHSGNRPDAALDALERGSKPKGPRPLPGAAQLDKGIKAKTASEKNVSAGELLERAQHAAQRLGAVTNSVNAHQPTPSHPTWNRDAASTRRALARSPDKETRSNSAASHNFKSRQSNATGDSTLGLDHKQKERQFSNERASGHQSSQNAHTSRRRSGPEQRVENASVPPLPPKPLEYKLASPQTLRALSTSSSSSQSSLTSDRSSPSTAQTTPMSSRTASPQGSISESRALAAISKQANYASFVLHLREMGKPHTYGTEMELEAIARMLDRPLHLFRTERQVEHLPDGSRTTQERLAEHLPEVTIGASRSGAPIFLRHRTEIDSSQQGAESNANHYDMVANLTPKSSQSLTLEKLNEHTQKTIGDGSCLFRSVASYLEMEQEAKGGPIRLDSKRQESDAHTSLRQRVVSWERDNALAELDYGIKLIDLA